MSYNTQHEKPAMCDTSLSNELHQYGLRMKARGKAEGRAEAISEQAERINDAYEQGRSAANVPTLAALCVCAISGLVSGVVVTLALQGLLS